jgi:hypothetical protein
MRVRLIVVGLLAMLTGLACTALGGPPPTPSLAPADATARSGRDCSTLDSAYRDLLRSADPAERAARTLIAYRDGRVEARVTLFPHAGDYEADWDALRRLYGIRTGSLGSNDGEVWVEVSRLCALTDDVRVANVNRPLMRRPLP